MANMLDIPKLRNLQKKMQGKGATQNRKLAVGLTRAGLHLQAVSEEIVPVRTGNLKNSAFTRASGVGTPRPEVRVGYTAGYALYVHENLDAWHKPGKEAKFLEGPFRTEQTEMSRLVREATK